MYYQAPKHVVVPYVENTLYSTNKYSCVRPVHTLYISYQHSVFAVCTDRIFAPNAMPSPETYRSEPGQAATSHAVQSATVGPRTSVRFLAQAGFPLHPRVQTHDTSILPVNLRYLHAKHREWSYVSPFGITQMRALMTRWPHFNFNSKHVLIYFLFFFIF